MLRAKRVKYRTSAIQTNGVELSPFDKDLAAADTEVDMHTAHNLLTS